MASYADVASHGPHQSAEEARAPHLPEVEHRTVTETSSLIDVDSPHIQSVSSDFESQYVKTETQFERIEHEAQDRARHAAHEARKEAKSLSRKAKKNADNPVVIGNAVVTAVVVGVVGVTAWRRYNSPEGFSWRTGFGLLAALGLFGAGDYFVSNWLFQKYPPKK